MPPMGGHEKKGARGQGGAAYGNFSLAGREIFPVRRHTGPTGLGNAAGCCTGARVAPCRETMAYRPRISLTTSSAPPRRRVALQASMLLVLALVTGLAYWDEERESKAALEDFAAEQSTLAASLAANLSVRLAMAPEG